MPNTSANFLVANAFSQWTSVSTAALTATSAGQLAEDVNGTNIAVNSSGALTAPADITPSATQTPVGIVYDFDGSVTDALLGAGAGDPSQCFWNAVYGGADNFGAGANFLHALVVINGQCALQSSQLTDVEYRLVRVLGGVLGLGWSQMNLNVITGNPPPTPDDYAGFPVMHYIDPVSCVPITVCYANPYQLASDDVAALSRLYPAGSRLLPPAFMARSTSWTTWVAAANPCRASTWSRVGSILPLTSPRISTGLRRFPDSSSPAMPAIPSHGLTDPVGNPYSEFGSSDQTLEGFFDLGGLPIPNGASTAQYQLAVEALDPLWSAGVCPYDPSQVAPSGTFPAILVTVGAGGNVEQDILMSGSAQPVPPWAATETWSAPAAVPSPGDWVGSLSGYGDVAYFMITAQANRTLSVAVTALDETGVPANRKPHLWSACGHWAIPRARLLRLLLRVLSTRQTFGMSRLDAQVLISNSFIIGIADLRGDGRPDYHYHAHVLYGDSVTPPRVPVNGGPITLQGTALRPGSTSPWAARACRCWRLTPGNCWRPLRSQSDGPQTITISDPVSGAFSIMTNALTFGAASTDRIVLLQGVNPPTPVGTQAANPVIGAGGRFRWHHSGERRNRGMDHDQRRRALSLRRRFDLLSHQRRKRNGFHLGYARRYGECGRSPRPLPPASIVQLSRSRPR